MSSLPVAHECSAKVPTNAPRVYECVSLLTRPAWLLRTSVYLYTQFRKIVILRSWPASRTDGATGSFRRFEAGSRSVLDRVKTRKCEIRRTHEITQSNLRPEAFRDGHEFKYSGVARGTKLREKKQGARRRGRTAPRMRPALWKKSTWRLIAYG